MAKDSNDCDLMNELFDSGVDEDALKENYHWHPVSNLKKENSKNKMEVKELNLFEKIKENSNNCK